MPPLRVSILGTGSSLKVFHQPSIAAFPDKFVIHSVFERVDRGRARAICGDAVRVVNSFEAVVGDKEVDLVRVCPRPRPIDTHVSWWTQRGVL